MPIDARIPLGTQPINAGQILGNAFAIRGARNRNALIQAQTEQTRAEATRNALAQRLGLAATQGDSQALNMLAAIDPSRAKTLGDIQRQQAQDKALYTARMAAAVQQSPNPAQAYPLARQQILQRYPDADLPEQYTPEVAQEMNMAIAKASKLADLTSPQLQQVYDPNSPTGTRFVRRTDALGRAGPAPRSATTVNVNTGALPFKIPSGYMLADANDPGKGVVPIPNGPADRQNATDAARTTMAAVGQRNVNEIQDAILNPDGTVNRDLVWQMQNYPVVGAVPFTEGRTLNVRMRDAISGRLRIETGAQANEGEIRDAMKRFMPSPLDSDETIRTKLQLFNLFMNGMLKRMRPDIYKAIVPGGKRSKKPPRDLETQALPKPAKMQQKQTFRYDPATGDLVPK